MLNVPNNCCWSKGGSDGRDYFSLIFRPTSPHLKTAKSKTTACTHACAPTPVEIGAPQRRSSVLKMGTKTVTKLFSPQKACGCRERICFLRHVAMETQRHHPALLSAKTFLRVQAYIPCSLCRSMQQAFFVLFFFVIFLKICSNTVDTVETGRLIGKKQLKFYINICVYEMTKML